MSSAARTSTVFLLVAGAVGCGSALSAPDAPSTTVETVHLVGVTLAGAGTLSLGESSRYRLWGSLSVAHDVEYSSSAQWVSLTPALLQMDKGVATGLAPCAAKLQATLVTADGTFVATKDVQVLATPPPPPSSLTISSFCASLYIIGQSCALEGVTELATWTSSDPLVASVAGGSVTPHKTGVTDLTATYLGVSAVLRVTVHSPVSIVVYAPFETIYVGQPVWLRATATFDDGAEKVVTDVAQWSVSDHLVMTTVNVSSPAISGVSAGSAEVVGAYGGASGALRVTVIPAAVDTLLLSPATDTWSGTLRQGGSGSFGLTVNYVLASAPTGTINLYIRDQNGVDVLTAPFAVPRSRSISSGQGFTSLSAPFTIPAGTTMLCPSAVMWGGAETTVTAPCVPIAK